MHFKLKPYESNNARITGIVLSNTNLNFSIFIFQATNNYILSLKKLILSISLVIGIHYLVVFVLLAAIYVRILFLVRAEHIKRHIAIQSSDCNLQYGTLAVARGDAAVPKTILLFLTIFVVTGATSEL